MYILETLKRNKQRGLNKFGYYTDFLCLKHNCTLKELAEKLDVPYTTLTTIRYGLSRKPSTELLNKIGKMEEQKDYVVDFCIETFYSPSIYTLQISETVPITQFYLSKKTVEGFSVSNYYFRSPSFNNHPRFRALAFCGVYYEAGKSRNRTLVDSWDYLKEQFYLHFYKELDNLGVLKDKIEELFKDRNIYYWTVLNFAFQKAQALQSATSYSYVILCESQEECEQIEQALPKKPPIKTTIEVITFKDELTAASNSMPLSPIQAESFKSYIEEVVTGRYTIKEENIQSYANIVKKIFLSIQNDNQLKECAEQIGYEITSENIEISDLSNYLDTYVSNFKNDSDAILENICTIIYSYCSLLKKNEYNEILELIRIDEDKLVQKHMNRNTGARPF